MIAGEHVYEDREFLGSGHLACQGCGAAFAMRHVLHVMGEDTIVVIAASCWSIIAGPFPYSALKVPILHTAFATAGAAASGVRASLDVQGRYDTKVLAWAGDGGTFDIGLQSLSGAAERNDDFLYVCYDNEAYMNTGIQRSSSTPQLAWTTTTPTGTPKATPKKNIVQILAAHKTPYVATANVAYPWDLMGKVRKAISCKGTKFLHILAPCPTGWKIPSETSIEVARLATETNVFPLYEVVNGEDYHITVEPKKKTGRRLPSHAGRFAHLGDKDIDFIQRRTDYEWRRLLNKSMMEPFAG
ncbi:MAG: thiamine pyrophosphate-dependent enzyme [Deltaproteobacteria bacterium]|nr:thiamine pyrophosphate-dependent enzyme [Deltaproteobacteria bacterium]